MRLTRELGATITPDSLRRMAYLERKHSSASTRSRARAAFDDVLDVPVRPFQDKYNAPTTRVSSGTWVSAVLYGDTHEPFADADAVSIVHSVISDLQPDIVIHMGDLVDCYTISRFDKDPAIRLHGLQDEIDIARAHLQTLRVVAPASRIVLLEGNHEDRLRRVVYAMQGSERALASLRVFQTYMAWPVLLGLPDLGIEFVPMGEQSRTLLLPKFLTVHGNRVSTRSGYTARAEHDRYGISGASGHTHRKATHYHRDHNGNHVWLETGCTCILRMDYVVDPDWQQGCHVVHFNTRTGAFSIEDVYVHQGNANWRGREYDANATRDVAPVPARRVRSRQQGAGRDGGAGGGQRRRGRRAG